MHTIKVYWRLLVLNWRKLLTYRADFISSLISHTVWASFSILQMILLTSKTSHVFGWSRNELLLLAGMYNVIFSFFYMFFSPSFNIFASIVYRGQLDSILIKPVDSEFLMTCMYISYTQAVRFVMGTGFLLYIMNSLHIIITPLIFVSAVLLIIFSVIIIFSVWMLVMTLTIWFPKLSNLTELLYSVNNIAKFPQEVYRGASIYLFFTLLPLTVVVVTPVKVLLQKALTGDILLFIVLSLVMFLLSRFFWQFALRYYTSASG